MCMLGIDIGTTNWKVVAYSIEGQALARWICPTKTHTLPGGWAEYDAEELWRTVCGGIRAVLAQLADVGEPAECVASVAITSMGESGVLLGKSGEPLVPIIAWYDPRTVEVSRFWNDTVGDEEVYRITGFPPQYIASLNKMMWLRNMDPMRCTKAWRWLCVADYIAFRLCGETVMDHSLASRTMAFDITTRTWSDTLLNYANVPGKWLPDLAPSGTAIGRVTATASAATGLTSHTVVSTGGHDHICGALAVGVVKPGECLDSLGTAEAILLTLDRPVLSSSLLQSGFALGCHTVPNRYYLIGSMQAAGGSIEWLCDAFGHDYAAGANPGTVNRSDLYHLLMDEAASAPPGSEGLLFLPHLLGAVCPSEPASRGSWVGLAPYHRRPHLLRSVVEGLSHEAFADLAQMEELSGLAGEARDITVIGGGTRNNLWMQTRADISGRVQRIPLTDEATTLGAAILGALGAGVFGSLDEAYASVRLGERRVEPSVERASGYQHAHQAYKQLFTALRPTFRLLAAQEPSSPQTPVAQ